MRDATFIGVLIGALGLLPAYVDVGRAAGTDNPSRDERFLRNALAAGLVEIELGQLASKSGSSAAVRQFGRWMVIDHES